MRPRKQPLPLPDFDFGPCCACGGTTNVRTIMMLNKRAPIPRTGWGCVQCGLSTDGAIAVLCDRCFAAKVPLREVCAGPATQKRRVPMGQVVEPFDHDLSKHPEEERVLLARSA